MRIAFIIHSHKSLDQVERLVSTIRQGCPNSVILISHDVKAQNWDSTRFQAFDAHMIRNKGGRGDFEIIDGYIAALQWLDRYYRDIDWVTNLSGQDYPVSSLRLFTDRLSSTKFDGFLHHFSAFDEMCDQFPFSWSRGLGIDRYHYQYQVWRRSLTWLERGAIRVPRLVLSSIPHAPRINTSFGLMVGVFANDTPFDGSFRCYAGSYWHSIRWECVKYLLHVVASQQRLTRYYRQVLIPDESFIQTVLVNNSRFRFLNNNLRYFDMKDTKHGHPILLDASYLDRMQKSGAIFARKFEFRADDPLYQILDTLALN